MYITVSEWLDGLVLVCKQSICRVFCCSLIAVHSKGKARSWQDVKLGVVCALVPLDCAPWRLCLQTERKPKDRLTNHGNMGVCRHPKYTLMGTGIRKWHVLRQVVGCEMSLGIRTFCCGCIWAVRSCLEVSYCAVIWMSLVDMVSAPRKVKEIYTLVHGENGKHGM